MKLTPEAVFSYLDHNHVDGSSTCFVGTFFDERQWYIDKTTWFLDRDEALKAAFRSGQKCIWDIEKANEILVYSPVKVVDDSSDNQVPLP